MTRALLTAAPVAIALALSASSAMALPVAPATPEISGPSDIHLTSGGNYYCEGRLFGKKARLWLEGDMPVRYKWSNRSTRRARMEGDTITIDASPKARLINVQIGKNSNGQKVIKGDWRFKDPRDNVVFTCVPE